MSEIGVVHLVRKKNGIAPFQTFIESYLKNPAGIDHELLILYKGFSGTTDIATHEELLRDIPHSFLMITDIGLDLRAYFVAAKKFNTKYLCFLNSFSIILDKDWLLKLYQHISCPGVGLVGATGSYLGIYGGLTGRRKYKSYFRHLLRVSYHFPRRFLLSLQFCPYPNYHIRTTGFMIMRDTMLKIRRGMLLTKIQSHMLESGKYSITKQIEWMGLRPIVVDKNGEGYEKNKWGISNTFWQGTQANLLISDNQTRTYDVKDSDWKHKREIFTWVSNESEFFEK